MHTILFIMKKVVKSAKVSAKETTNEVLNTLNAEISEALNVPTFTELQPSEVAKLTPIEQVKYFSELQTYLNEVEASNKKYGRANYKRTLNKFDFVLMQIYKAGLDGVTVSRLIKLGRGYKDRNDKLSAINVKTIVKDWNTKNVVLQRGCLYLNDATQFDKDSKRPKVSCAIMAMTKTAHPDSEVAKHKYTNDNVLTLISGQEEVKDYLLQRGATVEMLEA